MEDGSIRTTLPNGVGRLLVVPGTTVNYAGIPVNVVDRNDHHWPGFESSELTPEHRVEIHEV